MVLFTVLFFALASIGRGGAERLESRVDQMMDALLWILRIVYVID